eukprot:gnl/MRDRNA2_/MRDRNA2_76446_c0_seq1.p1 gnl/MRDRNA2_/MRDRNA2_76446_c0~~gnl/MRDRNA2_/MRDRNA2_76446_c0_seq1.p1  ORF type:complete len:390 (+),score=37.07 gnl/MRDRNA2_/MRDRNA2_76446_c0_seq1:103-1272(+)
MLLSHSVAVLLLGLAALSEASRVKSRKRMQNDNENTELDFSDEERAVQSQVHETLVGAKPGMICQYFNNATRKFTLDTSKGSYTMSVVCAIHEYHGMVSTKSTTYQYNVNIEGPGDASASFTPSPQRPTTDVHKFGTDLVLGQVSIEKINIALGAPKTDKALGMLWSDLASLKECHWKIVGNWQAIQHDVWGHFSIDPELELKCVVQDSYFHHTFSQISPFVSGHGPLDGEKQKLCKVMQSMKIQTVREDGTWTMSITCAVDQHESWHSSKLSTYKYEAQLEGPDGKVSFSPEPQRPVYQKGEDNYGMYEYIDVFALGSPIPKPEPGGPTQRTLGRLWPELGGAIDQCQWFIEGGHLGFQHPDLQMDPQLRLKCSIPDSYWSRSFKMST